MAEDVHVAHQQSGFTTAFGTTSIETASALSHLCPQQNPADFVSIAEMNRTVTKNGPLRVAAYIRVSKDSADQENSYESQDKYFKEMLTRNPEWVSAGVYSDYGISGTSKQGRTGYQRILRHCREGKIDRIVCKSISRFARNTSDFMAALDILHESRVTILFEKEGLDTADSTSDFILTTLAAIAQEESRTISSNIRWGIQKRYPKGEVRNYDVYGYRFAEGEDAMETLEDCYQIHRVEVIEEEAEVVRRIFHAVDEGMSYADVARMLNFEHIKAPNHGKPPKKIQGRSTVKAGVETGWTVHMISRMVSLERYCGDALLQKTYTPDFLTHKSRKNNGELPQYMVRDHHPAIIDRELFESVQAARKMNAAKYGNRSGEHRKRAFSGRLSCPHCGRNYNVRNTNRYPIWFCPTMALNNGKSICHAEKIYEDQIVRMFRKAFTDRFRLLAEAVMDDVKVADIMSGRYGEDEEQFCCFDRRACGFVSQISQRLENIQKTDFVERDRGFLKRQIGAREAAITESIRRVSMLRTQKDTLETRRRLQNDGSVKEDILSFTKRLKAESARLTEVQEAKRHLEKRLSYLEKYWEQVEYDYEDRERALAWIRTLPRGEEGTVAFLNGFTGEYVRAFALSITVHDPLHYTVHWFDDTKTEVEMYSNIEDYRYTSDYFDGNRMRQKYKRKM